MIRPNTYQASLTAVQPLLKAWRKKKCVDSVAIVETVACPACSGTMRVVKMVFGAYLSVRCNTPFCVQHQEWREKS